MSTRLLLGSVGLGLAAGMRAMTPQAALSLRSGRPSRIPLALGAVSEFVGDKLPIAGDRTDLPSLLTRLVSGAIAGRRLARLRHASTILPLLAGGLAAWASTYAFHALRIARRRGALLPAFAEDALAIGLTRASLRWS